MSRVRGAKWGLLLAFALLTLVVPQAAAQSDHRLRFRTIETEHFRIHYHEPLGVLAREIASEAEDINRRVEASLALKLRQRVEIVLRDESDGANGSARVIPYNVIELRAVAPDDMSALADYDHWHRLLLTHEHTHIVHLEQAGGLPRLAQILFGRFYTPQRWLPGWLKEGLATVQESEQTSAGRVRSTLFDMYMRMDALEDRVLGLDFIGYEGEPWPHGQVRYAYGQAFMAFLARRHGHAALGAFVREYGRRLVPYGMNRALRRATGETFSEAYRAFVAELRARARATEAQVEVRGRREGTRLTEHAELTRSPRFVSNEEIVYLVDDARRVAELRRMRLDQPSQPQRLTRVGSVGQVAPTRDGRVLFTQIDYHRGVYGYHELFAIGLDGSGRRKLTRGLRAREPDVSPDGKRVAYVTHGAGTSHLEVATLADVEHTRAIVVRSARGDQVFTPRWSPDGKRIAYSVHERGGYRDIWLLEVESGARTRLTYDRALDRGPVFSRDGRTLYFSSDRSGVANLYAYDLTRGALEQITNVVGGAFQPDVSPDGKRLVYLGYGSRGFDVYVMELGGPTLAPPAPYERPAPRALPSPAPLVARTYQPLHTLWPRYWNVTLEDSGRGVRAIVDTSGHDAVDLHRWSLRALSNLERREYAFEGAYVNRIARLPLLAYASVREGERRDLFVSRRSVPWQGRESRFSVATNLRVPRPLHAFDVRLEYTGRYLDKARPFDVPLDPNYPGPILPPLGYDAWADARVTFSRTRRQPFDISTSWGQYVTVASSLQAPWLGSRDTYGGISYRAEQFVRFRFRESVLALAYSGAHRWWSTLGGLPARLVPLADALLGTAPSPLDSARLRGHPTRSGEKLAVAQLEYRLLVTRLNRGYETLPIFARRIHAALFVDAGDAWSDAFDLRRVDAGVGAELRLDWASGFESDYTFRFGLARGVTPGGVLQWYTSLARPF